MRQCRQCGYLLPEAWETCKRCGTPVAGTPAPLAAGVPVGVQATGAGPAPPAAPPVPSAPAASAGPPAPPPAIGGGFDPRYAAPARLGFPAASPAAGASGLDAGRPPPVRAPARPLSRRIAVAVLALGLVGAWFGWQRLRAAPALPAEAVSYIDGAGVVYEPFNQGYRVRLPRAPAEKTDTVDQGGVSVTYSAAYVEYEGRYELGTGTADLPFVVPADVANELLSDAAVSAVAAGTGIELLEQVPTQFAGRPALDAKLDAPDGDPARVLVVLDGSRIVVAFTHATSRNDDLFEALRDSLELTG